MTGGISGNNIAYQGSRSRLVQKYMSYLIMMTQQKKTIKNLHTRFSHVATHRSTVYPRYNGWPKSWGFPSGIRYKKYAKNILNPIGLVLYAHVHEPYMNQL